MVLKKMLGDILKEMEFITQEQLDEALEEQRKIFTEKTLPIRLAPDRLVAEAREAPDAYQIPLLGQILIDKGFTTVERLQEALREQEKMRDAYESLDKESLITFLETSYLIHSSLNPAEILSRIMIQINRVTRSVAGTLLLLDEKTNELVFSVPTGPMGKQLTDIRLPPGEGIAGWVAEHGEPLIIPDVKEDPRFYGGIDSETGFETKSILCVPLKVGAKLIGVVEVINRKDGTPFTEKDLLLLSIFASHAALVIEKARFYRELQERVQEVLANTAELEKSKQDLQRSERRYRNIFNNSLVPLWEEDISELRAAIEALKERGISDFRRYIDEHPEFVAEAVKLTKILDVNKATLRLYRIEQKEELPAALEKAFTAEGMPVLKEELIAIAEGKRHIEGETAGYTPRGKRLNLLIKITIPQSEDIDRNMLLGIMDITDLKTAQRELESARGALEKKVAERTAAMESSVKDLQAEIRERRHAEAALLSSEEKYQSLADRLNEIIWTIDRDGKITNINRAVKPILGYDPQEMVGRSFREFVHAEDLSWSVEALKKTVSSEPVYHQEIRVVSKDGTMRWLRVSGHPVVNGEEVVSIQGLATDVTQTKELQAQLIRSEKLAVLGQLAAGVGHELRNPLGVISNSVYYLKIACSDWDKTARECLDVISSEVRNAEKTISDLLWLSRTRAAERQRIGLSDLVSHILEKYSVEGKIRVRIDIPSEIPAVFVDPLQIEQVLQNLIANGCQAMDEGGELFIRAMAVQERVEVSISDTGSGIPRENLGKIFEPLFTTKARGMGLGLAVSRNLVELNGGRIEVASEEGVGSIFTISLPAEQ